MRCSPNLEKLRPSATTIPQVLTYLELEVRPSNGRRLCCGAQLEPKLPASHDQSSAGSHGDEGRGGVTERSRPDEEKQKLIAAGRIS